MYEEQITKIRSAMEQAREDGFTIEPGDFGVSLYNGAWQPFSDTLCPLGCVLRNARQIHERGDVIVRDTAEILNVADSWVMGFWETFDRPDYIMVGQGQDFVNGAEVGRQFRKEVDNYVRDSD